MKISSGHITMSIDELAGILVAVSEDLELQKTISETTNKMEQFCNAIGCGDEEPTDIPDETDLRYEIVGTYIDYITEEDESDGEDELDFDYENDDDIPF